MTPVAIVGVGQEAVVCVVPTGRVHCPGPAADLGLIIGEHLLFLCCLFFKSWYVCMQMTKWLNELIKWMRKQGPTEDNVILI